MGYTTGIYELGGLLSSSLLFFIPFLVYICLDARRWLSERLSYAETRA